MAGMVPSTGRMRTRKSASTPSSPTLPFSNSSCFSGCSSALPGPGRSVLYTTGIPELTPSKRSLRRVDLDSGSSVEVLMSPMKRRVGSLLQPAPMEEITGMLFM